MRPTAEIGDPREQGAASSSANGTSLSAAGDDARQVVTRELAARFADHREELARRIVESRRQEILDYRAASEAGTLDEELSFALENVDVLVASMESGEPVGDDHFERSREIAARRVHQGIPLESLLHAGRLWERLCLEMVLSVARTEVPHEREAAVEIARRIADHADRVATAAAGAFRDEVANHGLLRRDLLDALLSANGDGHRTERLARLLRLRLATSYVVVVVRGEGVALPALEQPRGAGRALDRIVEQIRTHMRPSAGSLLVALRNGDVIVLYPAAGSEDLDKVRQACEALGVSLGAEVSIGMSGWHEGRASVSRAFIEAANAVKIAASTGIRGRAVGLDEVLVDSMLDSSLPARRILKETLKPLFNYDASRKSALIETLRAYLDARLNVTKAAAALFVNPNTVVYRLKRIKEVCGRDPHHLEDRLVLSLALKLTDLPT